jgi:hypothetical protein
MGLISTNKTMLRFYAGLATSYDRYSGPIDTRYVHLIPNCPSEEELPFSPVKANYVIILKTLTALRSFGLVENFQFLKLSDVW